MEGNASTMFEKQQAINIDLASIWTLIIILILILILMK
jgi:hypothetical protein